MLVFVNEKASRTAATGTGAKFNENLSHHLEVVNMDGKQPRLLYDLKDTSQYDITFDPITKRVYWLHLTRMQIESISLEGLFCLIPIPLSFTVAYLYIGDARKW